MKDCSRENSTHFSGILDCRSRSSGKRCLFRKKYRPNPLNQTPRNAFMPDQKAPLGCILHLGLGRPRSKGSLACRMRPRGPGAHYLAQNRLAYESKDWDGRKTVNGWEIEAMKSTKGIVHTWLTMHNRPYEAAGVDGQRPSHTTPR